ASCLSNHRRFHCAGATGRPCPFCQRSFRSSSSLQMHIRWKHRADAAAAVAAAAAAAAASNLDLENTTLLSSVSIASSNMNNVTGLMAPITSNSGVRMDSLLGATMNIGSPNKRKWRRKSKPKQAQNAFGKLVCNYH
ncbi:unnamed protein product, partial [Trichobilharzia regenti]